MLDRGRGLQRRGSWKGNSGVDWTCSPGMDLNPGLAPLEVNLHKDSQVRSLYTRKIATISSYSSTVKFYRYLRMVVTFETFR